MSSVLGPRSLVLGNGYLEAGHKYQVMVLWPFVPSHATLVISSQVLRPWRQVFRPRSQVFVTDPRPRSFVLGPSSIGLGPPFSVLRPRSFVLRHRFFGQGPSSLGLDPSTIAHRLLSHGLRPSSQVFVLGSSSLWLGLWSLVPMSQVIVPSFKALRP